MQRRERERAKIGFPFSLDGQAALAAKGTQKRNSVTLIVCVMMMMVCDHGAMILSLSRRLTASLPSITQTNSHGKQVREGEENEEEDEEDDDDGRSYYIDRRCYLLAAAADPI